MMIFNQNSQSATKRNQSYVAKQFDLFWVKRAFYDPEIY